MNLTKSAYNLESYFLIYSHPSIHAKVVVAKKRVVRKHIAKIFRQKTA